MKKDATIDATQQYRYTLLREWDSNAPRVAFVMLNPSTGDAEIDDNTINRCINFARLWEYGSIEIVNLFGYRSKSFDYIKGASNPIGNENNEFIITVVNRASIVVAAWGDNGTYLSRDLEVIALISEVKDVYCLGITSKGNPRHPLYLDSSTMLEMYKPRDERFLMKVKEELQLPNVQDEEVASPSQISSAESVSSDLNSSPKNLLGEDIVNDEQNKIKVTDKRCAAQRCDPTQDELTNKISLGLEERYLEERGKTKTKTETEKISKGKIMDNVIGGGILLICVLACLKMLYDVPAEIWYFIGFIVVMVVALIIDIQNLTMFRDWWHKG